VIVTVAAKKAVVVTAVADQALRLPTLKDMTDVVKSMVVVLPPPVALHWSPPITL
jgi:hypothetical protein